MPVTIEELPDDYDEAQEHARASQCAQPTGSNARSSASSSLRKGFLTGVRGGGRRSQAGTDHLTAQAEGAAAGAAETTSARAPASAQESNGHIKTQSHADNGPLHVKERVEASACSNDEVLDGMRQRLNVAIDKLTARCREDQGSADDSIATEQQLEELFANLQAKFQTSQTVASRARAVKDVESAVADMRAASNDLRRHRSGEERAAAAELRRSVQDATERVRKVADAASARAPSEKDCAQAAVAAFHKLPLTAKLRLMADESVGRLLLVSAFLAGSLLMLGVMAEFYTAWNCRIGCL